jgi:hypothetical protein
MGTRLRGHQYAKESKAKLVDQQPVARTSMQKPPLNPDVSDTAPFDPVLPVYDEKHLITYLRLLDADAAVEWTQGCPWLACGPLPSGLRIRTADATLPTAPIWP